MRTGSSKQPSQQKEEEIQLEEAGIHYEIHGNGPVLMVLPNSWGINIPPLRAFFSQLENRLTPVYFDPRGIGDSGEVQVKTDISAATVRQDFDALRRHLGLAKANVIGWSNGATNLVLLASESPESISKAIFLHGSASFTAEDNEVFAKEHPELVRKYAAFLGEMNDPSLSDGERNSRLRRLWLEEYFPVLAADPEKTKPKVEETFRDCPFSWRHLSYSEREWPTFDFRDRLPLITAPSLILAGARDLIPTARAEEMQKGIPESRLVIFQSSGHFAPLEEPEAFQNEVFDWIGP
jgi:pimeloyl-ACP methyl ester carboxylesterase